MDEADKRIHARIHVSTRIEISTPAGIVEAELKDLSKGGARFQIATAVGEVGETVELFLPSLDKSEVAVMAQITRVIDLADGLKDYGVRFDMVEPAMREQLRQLIDVLLSASGGGRRAHPRVARRIEVRFGDLADLHAILEDISAGGLTMTVDEPLALYEEVDVSVPDMAGGELLILHGRVVNQREHRSPDSPTIWRVGLEFTQMRPEAASCLQALMRSVLDASG
jgi:c-di-GMP-binding flagellar brake protein YcgR